MYTIRPFAFTDQDYESGVRLHNAAWPDDATTVAHMKHRDANRQQEYLLHRLFIEDAGVPIALGIIFESSWAHQPGKYGMDLDLPPTVEEEPLAQIFFDYAVDFLDRREPAPVKLVAYGREDRVSLNDFWREQGFHLAMRYPVSRLDVGNYDFSRFTDVEEKVTAGGIQIWRLTELMEADPHYREKIYGLEGNIDRDIPSPDPVTTAPFEHFVKMFQRPDFTPDGWFLAVDPAGAEDDPIGAYVGMSTLWPAAADATKFYVGLTGVLRSHRRRGIARALKLRTFHYARQVGRHIIETDNEENNPMYALNLALGFEPRPAWLEFEKVLPGGGGPGSETGG